MRATGCDSYFDLWVTLRFAFVLLVVGLVVLEMSSHDKSSASIGGMSDKVDFLRI